MNTTDIIKIKDNQAREYIGLILVKPSNMNSSVSNTSISNTAVSNTAVSNTAVSNTAVSNTAKLISINVTNILVNTDNNYPTVPFILTKDFKYKKYIRDHLKNVYNIKKKKIFEIKLLNTYKKLHNYIIVLNSIQNIKHTDCIISIYRDSLHLGWKPITDLYVYSKDILSIHEVSTSVNFTEIYKIIYNKYILLNKENIYNQTFKSALVYQNSFNIRYLEILLIISNMSFV